MAKTSLKVDLGNGVVKIKGENGKYYNFRSTIVPNRRILRRTEGTHIVNIDGVGSIIGAKDGKTFPGDRRYERSDYLYTLLTAICVGYNNVKDLNINADVALNLPLELYKEEKYREKLKEFENIKDKKVILDGVEYNVSIDSVTPLPEGLLINTLSEEEVKNKRNMFLDFGYGTLDIIIAFEYDIELILTLKLGVATLYGLMAQKLNTSIENIEYYYNMPEEAIINCQVKDITDIKESCLREYTDDILSKLERLNGGSLEGIYKVYFLGGGSEVIYDDFSKCIKNNTEKVENSTYANVDIFDILVDQQEEVAEEQDNKIKELEEEKKKINDEHEALKKSERKDKENNNENAEDEIAASKTKDEELGNIDDDEAKKLEAELEAKLEEVRKQRAALKK